MQLKTYIYMQVLIWPENSSKLYKKHSKLPANNY